ncbi:beta strand repeat-containing protein, partial [Candidatus Omnitrophota bacterium]
GPIDVHGNVTVEGDWDGGNGSIRFIGDGDRTFTTNDIAFTPRVTVNKDSATNTVTLVGALDATHLYIVEGALDLNGHDLVVSGTFDISADGVLKIQGTETYTAPTQNLGALGYSITDPTFTIPNQVYDNLVLDGSSETVFSLPASMTGLGTLTIENGTLDVAGYDLSGDTLRNAGTLRIEGDEAITFNTVDTTAGTIEYAGGGDYTGLGGLAAGSEYHDLVFSGTGHWEMSTTVEGDWTIESGTVDMTGDVDVTGSVIIEADGTLNSNEYNVTLAGNWDNSGAFDGGTGEIVLNGTNQSILGETTFNNLTKTVTTADILMFENTKTQTIANVLTLQGASGELLSLRSDQDGTQWNIDPQGTRTVEYLDIKDSYNVNQTPIDVRSANCIEPETAPNNIGWMITTPLDYTWIGLGSGNLWSTPENWQTAVPGSVGHTGATAVFSNITAKDCIIDGAAPASVGGMEIQSGYTGTITQAVGTFTISGNYSQAGGTFEATYGTTALGGNFTYAVGSAFNVSGTHTLEFNKDDKPTITLNSQTLNVHNLKIDISAGSAYYVDDGSIIKVDGTLTLSRGSNTIWTAWNGRVDVYGDVVVESTWNGGDGYVHFRGGGAQNIATNDTAMGSRIWINKAEGVAVTVTGNFTCRDLNIQAGTFDVGSNDVLITTEYNQTGGTFSQSAGTLKITGAAFKHSAGIFDVGPTHTLEFNGSNKQYFYLSGTLAISNFKMNTEGYAYYVTSGGILKVNGNTTFAKGGNTVWSGWYGYTDAYGDVTVESTWGNAWDKGGYLRFRGNGDQTFDLTGGVSLFDDHIWINKGGGAVNLASDLTMDLAGQDLRIEEGVFNLNEHNLSVADVFQIQDGGTLSLYGEATQSSTTPTLQSGSSVNYNGTGSYASLKLGNSYPNSSIVFSGAGTYTLDGDLAVGKNITLESGALDAGGASTITVSGNWTVSGASFNAGTCEVVFNGDSTGYEISSGGESFYDVTFNNATGGWTVMDAITVDNDLTLTDGAVTQEGDLSIAGDYVQSGGTFTATDPDNYTLTVGGNFTIPTTDDSFMRYTGGGWHFRR